MKASKSRRLRALALLVVLAALVVALLHNGLSSKPQSINSRDMDRVYENLTNANKVKLDVSVNSLDQLNELVNKELDNQGSVKLGSEEQGNYCLYIYQLTPDQLPKIISNLSQIGSISSKSESLNPNSTQIDLENKLRDREARYQIAKQNYKGYSYQDANLSNIEKEIDSLKILINNQKNLQMPILYIRAQAAASGIGKMQHYKNILLDFIKYVIIFALGIAILYFGSILIVYIFSLLGVRFPSFSNISNRGYNYYSGYKGYHSYGGYGGYGDHHKRRVKRIYRSKHSSDTENKDADKQ